MKNQKGITLVALIITIIVMVILAAVIIVSAVADGGIIDRAEEAMKKKERAEAEELVIASYVYKTTASMTTIGTLDLNATADAIYENLTSNGFTLMDGNIEAGSGSDILEGNKIELDIIGKHGNYGGTVTDKGLQGNLKPLEEANNDTAGDTADNTNTDEEISWVECQGALMYIGADKELKITSSTLTVEEIVLNETKNDYIRTGKTKEINFSDIAAIIFGYGPDLQMGTSNIEKVDLGNKITKDIIIYAPLANNLKEIKGLEGLKTFGNDAFAATENLENVEFPSTLTTIETSAFQGTKLTKITIPSGVTSIASNAFQGCKYLTEVTINKTKAEVEAEGGIGTAWIPDSVTKIIYSDDDEKITKTYVYYPEGGRTRNESYNYFF